MAEETTLTIIGNTTSDAELRFTPSGDAVANFTVASTPRIFDKNSKEWKDGDTLFMRCAAWRDLGQNVAESITKGTRVMVTGILKQRSYEKDGEKRTVIELEVQEVGPSLKYATATIVRTPKGGNGKFAEPVPSHHGTQQPAQQQPWGGQPQTSEWGNGPSAQGPAF